MPSAISPCPAPDRPVDRHQPSTSRRSCAGSRWRSRRRRPVSPAPIWPWSRAYARDGPSSRALARTRVEPVSGRARETGQPTGQESGGRYNRASRSCVRLPARSPDWRSRSSMVREPTVAICPGARPGFSAWGTLVSEFMLQQTPVVRVIPRLLEWLERWPTPADLAAVPPGEAVRAWGRLGYPRRALALHACATAIAGSTTTRFPRTWMSLLALPGIGPYTARAVAAFAYGRRHPVVDVNVRRVLARAVDGQGQPGPGSDEPRPRLDGRPSAGRPRGGARLQRRNHGAGRDRVHRACTAVRRMPDRGAVRLACGWLSGVHRCTARRRRSGTRDPIVRPVDACSASCGRRTSPVGGTARPI